MWNRVTIQILVYLSVLLYLILKTRYNLDFVFSARGIEAAEVRQKIRKHNSRAVMVFYSAVLLLFNLNKIIQLILRFIKFLSIKLKDFIIYILKLLFREKESSIPEDGFGFIPFDPSPAWKPIVVLIFYTAINFIFLLSVYLLLPLALKGLKNFIASIRSKLLHPDLRGCYSPCVDSSECVDTVETIKISRQKDKRHKEDLNVLFKNTADLSLKLRILYRMLLEAMTARGITLKKSDTAREICKKAASLVEAGEFLFPATRMYEEVRYGEVSPSNELLSRFENYCAKINSLFRK